MYEVKDKSFLIKKLLSITFFNMLSSILIISQVTKSQLYLLFRF